MLDLAFVRDHLAFVEQKLRERGINPDEVLKEQRNHLTEEIARLKKAKQVQQIRGDTVELAYVDQGYTSETAAQAATEHGIQLEVVKHTEAKRGFVLLSGALLHQLL